MWRQKDKADSVAYSDVKSVNIEFIVDKTAPTYTLTGVDKNNENYIGSKNAVLMPKDDGGKLGRVKITVVGKDDKEKKGYQGNVGETICLTIWTSMTER